MVNCLISLENNDRAVYTAGQPLKGFDNFLFAKFDQSYLNYFLTFFSFSFTSYLYNNTIRNDRVES